MSKTYKELKLSDVKKERMIQIIKKGKSPASKKKSFVPIVVPLFAFVAILLFLTTNNASDQIVTGAGKDLSEATHEIFFKETIILWSVSLLFLITAYMQFVFLASKPNRLVEYRIFKWAHDKLNTKRRLIIIFSPFVKNRLENP